MKKEDWDAVLRTNLDFAFNMTRLVIEGMRTRGFGRIVNISSINGRKGQVGQANHSVAKAGLLGFSKAVAQESASRGITCNVIAPGYIGTEMVQAVPKEILDTRFCRSFPSGASARRRRSRAASPSSPPTTWLHHRRLPRRQRRAVHGVTIFSLSRCLMGRSRNGVRPLAPSWTLGARGIYRR